MAYRYPAPTKSGYRYSRRRQWPQWYRIEKLKEGELPGVLIEQRVRCGKPSCKCASGEEAELHGPYHYRVWREGGKQRKQYVRRIEVEEVRAAIQRRTERLGKEREERKRHMRRGEYSWKAQHPEQAREQEAEMLRRVRRSAASLLRLRASLRQV